MPFTAHPGSLLRRELKARELSANRLALDLSVPLGRITMSDLGSLQIPQSGPADIVESKFWLDLQSQYDIAVIEHKRGAEIARLNSPRLV